MTDLDDPIRFRLLFIDAWRDPDGCWQWNKWHEVATDIVLTPDRLTPRKLFWFLRREGWLAPSDFSAGKVMLDPLPTDRYHLTVCNRNTGEPLMCLEEMEPDHAAPA